MSQTTVKPCSCKNAYQDRQYGSGNRVHNVADKNKIGQYPTNTCTVCGTKRT